MDVDTAGTIGDDAAESLDRQKDGSRERIFRDDFAIRKSIRSIVRQRESILSVVGSPPLPY